MAVSFARYVRIIMTPVTNMVISTIRKLATRSRIVIKELKFYLMPTDDTVIGLSVG